MFLLWSILLLSSIANSTFTTPNRLSSTSRDGIDYTVFEHGATGARIEFTKNSGICETTPNITQYSGYLSVGEDMNMWFWFRSPLPLHLDPIPAIPPSRSAMLIPAGE